MIDEIELQILTQSYWTHFKEAKDLALYYPPEHPKMILFAAVIEELRVKIEAKKRPANTGL